jgi:CxxC motif-containing protein
MMKTFTCIICPNGCEIEAQTDGVRIVAIEGATCNRGLEYVEQELKNPQRNIATLVKVDNGDEELVSVRLTNAVPRDRILDVMVEIKKVRLTAPVVLGQTVLENVLGLNSDVIATKSVSANANGCE